MENEYLAKARTTCLPRFRIASRPELPPEPPAAVQTTDQKGIGVTTLVYISLLISLITSFASLYIYDRWFALKIVAVDIRGYIAQQRDSYLAGKMTEDELKKSFDRLERVVIAIPKNKVVIMGDAAVRNIETIKP
jgi:hypothetical protein